MRRLILRLAGVLALMLLAVAPASAAPPKTGPITKDECVDVPGWGPGVGNDVYLFNARNLRPPGYAPCFHLLP